ncbi:MAG: T9SS type A sorting domain-containing protein [Chitinophagaceae bacterium]
MRYIYTFFVSLITYVGAAQITLTDDLVMPLTKDTRSVNVCGMSPINLTDKSSNKKEVHIQEGSRVAFHCMSTVNNSREPLYVLDGFVIQKEDFLKINPDDIESIDVLKEVYGPGIWFCGPGNGVIVITTKGFQKKIIIKDAITSSELPGATVTYQKKEKTFTAFSNDSGVVIMNKFRVKDEYEMKITMMGYVDFKTAVINNSKEQTILLTRDIKTCSEVVVANSYCTKKWITSCGYSITRLHMIADTGIDRSNSVLFKVFPNPVNAGRDISIDTKENLPASATVKIFNMSGQLLLTRPVSATNQKGQLTIHIENNWTAGIYIVQLSDKNGHTLQSSKLIIQ